MKYIGTAFMVVLLAAIALGAQASGGYFTGGALVYSVDSSVTIAMCGTPPVGKFSKCTYGTGEAYSLGTGTTPTWVVSIPPATTSPTLTLQGVTKTLPASFSITAGAATIAAQ
jgi:hypothetical protein